MPLTTPKNSLKQKDQNIFSVNTASAISNLVNSVIGLSIVAIPAALVRGGLIFGITMMLLCSILVVFTSDLMIKVKKKLEKRSAMSLTSKKAKKIMSYGELCEICVGKWLFYLLCLITFLMMFGAMGVYSVLLKKEMANIIGDLTNEIFIYDKYLLLGVSLIFILPLCLFRKINTLSFTSFISATLVFIIIIITIAVSPKYYKLLKSNNPTKMLTNELKLNKERALFLCEVANSDSQNLYPITHENFNIIKPKDYKTNFINQFKNNALCTNNEINKILIAVEQSKGTLEFDQNSSFNNIETPKNWKEVLEIAHANYLLSKYSFIKGDSNDNNNNNNTLFVILSTMGVYASALICQQSTFSIFGQMNVKEHRNLNQNDEKNDLKNINDEKNDLKNENDEKNDLKNENDEQIKNFKTTSLKRWRIVQLTSFVIILICYLSIGLVGYYTQKYQVGDSIFDKMKVRYYDSMVGIDYTVNISRIMLIITIILTYPMQNFFARKNLFLLFFALVKKTTNRTYDDENPKAIFYYPITLTLFFLILMVGLFLNQIILVYSLIGALFACPMTYIIPCICYLNAYTEGGFKAHYQKAYKKKGMFLANFILTIFTILFGCFILVVSTATSIYSNFK